jgi:hypothetical protein
MWSSSINGVSMEVVGVFIQPESMLKSVCIFQIYLYVPRYVRCDAFLLVWHVKAQAQAHDASLASADTECAPPLSARLGKR